MSNLNFDYNFNNKINLGSNSTANIQKVKDMFQNNGYEEVKEINYASSTNVSEIDINWEENLLKGKIATDKAYAETVKREEEEIISFLKKANRLSIDINKAFDEKATIHDIDVALAGLELFPLSESGEGLKFYLEDRRKELQLNKLLQKLDSLAKCDEAIKIAKSLPVTSKTKDCIKQLENARTQFLYLNKLNESLKTLKNSPSIDGFNYALKIIEKMDSNESLEKLQKEIELNKKLFLFSKINIVNFISDDDSTKDLINIVNFFSCYDIKKLPKLDSRLEWLKYIYNDFLSIINQIDLTDETKKIKKYLEDEVKKIEEELDESFLESLFEGFWHKFTGAIEGLIDGTLYSLVLPFACASSLAEFICDRKTGVGNVVSSVLDSTYDFINDDIFSSPTIYDNATNWWYSGGGVVGDLLAYKLMYHPAPAAVAGAGQGVEKGLRENAGEDVNHWGIFFDSFVGSIAGCVKGKLFSSTNKMSLKGLISWGKANLKNGVVSFATEFVKTTPAVIKAATESLLRNPQTYLNIGSEQLGSFSCMIQGDDVSVFQFIMPPPTAGSIGTSFGYGASNVLK